MSENTLQETTCVLVVSEFDAVVSEAICDLGGLLYDEISGRFAKRNGTDETPFSSQFGGVYIIGMTLEDLRQALTQEDYDLPYVYSTAQRRVLVAADSEAYTFLDNIREMGLADENTIIPQISEALVRFAKQEQLDSVLFLNINEADREPNLKKHLEEKNFPFVKLDEEVSKKIQQAVNDALLFCLLDDWCSTISEDVLYSKVQALRDIIDAHVPEGYPIIFSNCVGDLMCIWDKDEDHEDPRELFSAFDIYCADAINIACNYPPPEAN